MCVCVCVCVSVCVCVCTIGKKSVQSCNFVCFIFAVESK